MKKLLLLMVFLASPAFADDVQPRLVSVTGEGEVFTVPDEVHVNLQVESFDPVLEKAKASNDEAIAAVLALMKKYGVEDKDFQTDYFTVRNEERYYFDQASQQQRSKKGFFVNKNVAVVVRDVSKFEALYSEALESGVNNLSGVEFKSSKAKELRAEARKLAVQNAKEKAALLAGELGQEILRPYQISENVTSEPWPRPMMMMAKAGMAEDAGGAPSTVALGQIKISSSVSVSFELK